MTQLAAAQTIAFNDPQGPRFEGQYAGPPPGFGSLVTVVNYNINHGREVRKAIEAFETHEPLPAADIILLQEMDEGGTEAMAKALGCNFVYYPATVSRYGRNFGNAILARWPLAKTRKLILPELHPLNGVMRIAVGATVQIAGLDVMVYSVHTEIFTVPAAHRQAQVVAIIDDIGPGDSPVIVGGDFNTVTKRGINWTTDQFAEIGLSRKSAGAGPTVTKLGIKPSAADHIFTRGFCRVGRGAVEEANASDHFPLWVQLIHDPGDCLPGH
jgi:endonuclease/exonuclease/phosphatase family metal-dependent hydrolase